MDHPKHTKKYEKIPQPAPQRCKQQKPVPAPRKSKLHEPMALPPLNRPIPAPRSSVKEVAHFSRPIPAPRQSVKKSVKTDIYSIHDNKSKQMMDQASIEHKTPRKLVTQKEHIMDQYPAVFEGIGQFPGEPYHNQIDQKVLPKQTPCRMVPVHQKELFKKELDKMVDAGILKPVHDSQPWINSFVIVESKESQN